MEKIRLLWIWIKSLLKLPMYPIDILRWTRYRYVGYPGLCCSMISCASELLGSSYSKKIEEAISAFTYENAMAFRKAHNDTTEILRDYYWWPMWEWKKDGRLGFLNWMIEEMKSDKTDLREICRQEKNT